MNKEYEAIQETSWILDTSREDVGEVLTKWRFKIHKNEK
jgi:hypothetical protein